MTSDNPTLNVIRERKSVRKYSDKPIDEQSREAIIKAALQAPSAGAMMLYSIIEIDDPETKKILAERCDHQPFIAEAPFVLLFVADYQRWMDYYNYAEASTKCAEFERQPRTPEEGDFLLACLDTMAAAQNAVIAAESLGIGSCYIGDILEHYEENVQTFDLPRYTAPLALICFGYPERSQIDRPFTPRFDSEYIVHKEKYRRFSPDELAQMQPKGVSLQQDGSYAGLTYAQRNYIRKFTAEFSIEMSRSVKKMLENWRKDTE